MRKINHLLRYLTKQLAEWALYPAQCYSDFGCWVWARFQNGLTNILNYGIPTDAEFDEAFAKRR